MCAFAFNALASKHPTSAELFDRLTHAAQLNSLNAPGMKPWLLEGKFQRFNIKGKLIEQGTIAEGWLNPDLRRIAVGFPSNTQTFVYTQGHEFHSAGADHLPDSAYLLLPELTEPIDSDDWKDLDPPEQEHGASSGCILFRWKKSADPEEGYCLTPEGALESNVVIGPLVGLRKSIKIFQGHFVPASIDLSDGKRVFYSFQLTALAEIPASSVNLSTDNLLQYPDPIPPHGTTLPPIKDFGFPYATSPFEAQTIVLRVITGRDGRVRRVDTLCAQDEQDAQEVADSYRRWSRPRTIYQGEPVERDEVFIQVDIVNVDMINITLH